MPATSEISAKPLRALASILVFLLISQLVRISCAIFSLGYYSNPKYYTLWSPLLMSLGNPAPGMGFFFESIFFGLFSAIIFVFVYTVIGGSIRGSPAGKGMLFGAMVFLLATVSGSLSMFLLLNIPAEIIILWGIEGLAVYLLAGAATGIIMAGPEKRAEVKSKIAQLYDMMNASEHDKYGPKSEEKDKNG